jgi:hypothetical protein
MEKINLKTMFKSILENRIRKNINFGKRFPKTICEGKIGISKGSKDTLGGKEKKSLCLIHTLLLLAQKIKVQCH